MKRVIVLLLSTWTGTALAAGFTTADRGVIALGSGGTGVARAGDPAANVYNPAAATTDRGIVLSAGVAFAAPSLTAEGPGWSSSTEPSLVTPPMFHLRYAGERFAAGASLTVPFGSRISWPTSWPGRFELLQAKLQVLRLSAFAGTTFDRLAIAAGPFVDFGTLRLARALDFIEEEGSTSMDMRARGAGVTAAAFYRPIDALALGLTYHSRSTLSFSGYADFDVPPELSGRAQDSKINSRLQFPDRITLGGLYAIDDELEVALDLELVLWSTIDELAIDFDTEGMADVVQPRDWHTTIAPRIGAKYAPAALDFLTIRAGAFLDPSPVPAATAGPSSPDSTRFGLTLGAGAELLQGLTFDSGYQLIFFTGVQSEAMTPTLNGVSYSGHVHLFGAALTYRL